MDSSDHISLSPSSSTPDTQQHRIVALEDWQNAEAFLKICINSVSQDNQNYRDFTLKSAETAIQMGLLVCLHLEI